MMSSFVMRGGARYFPEQGRYPQAKDGGNDTNVSDNAFSSNKNNDKQDTARDHRGGGQVMTDFADNTTIAGVFYIKNASRTYQKVAWATIFVGFLAIASLQLYGVFTRYYSYPTSTDIKYEHKILDFPSVTLCNMNSIRASMVEEDDYLSEFVELVQRTYARPLAEGAAMAGEEVSDYLDDVNIEYDNDYFDYDYDDDDDDYEEEEEEEGEFGGTVDTTLKIIGKFKELLGSIDTEARRAMGHDIEIMLMKCTFNGKTCHAANFTHTLSKDYGNCYTFNSHLSRKHSFKTRFTGTSFGLTMQLYKGSADYINGITTGGGFRVVVHPFGTLAFPLESGVSISPGRETSIALNFENITRPGGKYGRCGNDDLFSEYGGRYTKQACENVCSSKLIYKECKCYLPEDIENYPASIIKTLKPCTTEANSIISR